MVGLNQLFCSLCYQRLRISQLQSKSQTFQSSAGGDLRVCERRQGLQIHLRAGESPPPGVLCPRHRSRLVLESGAENQVQVLGKVHGVPAGGEDQPQSELSQRGLRVEQSEYILI